MNETPDKTGLAQEAHARDVVARDRRHIWHPYTQHGTAGDPLLITGARGASLFDAQGREILDLIASWWTCTHGHAHPKLNEALARQANEIEHVMFAGFTHEPAVNLATALAEILPGDLSRVFFSDDGSTAVEVALKIAYQYWANRGDTRKRVFISFDGGYHGDTLGAMSLGRGSGFFTLYRSIMCQVAVLPFPYTFDGDEAAEDRETGALTALEDRLRNGAHDVAALIIEPLLQGAAGMRICRPEFIKRIVEMAHEAGHPRHLRRGGDGLRPHRNLVRHGAGGRRTRPRLPVEGPDLRLHADVGDGRARSGVRDLPRRHVRARPPPRPFLHRQPARLRRGAALARAVPGGGYARADRRDRGASPGHARPAQDAR